MDDKRVYVFLALALLLIPQIPLIYSQPSIDDEVSAVMRDLEYLSSRGVNVSDLVDRLNHALELYQRGDVDGALNIIRDLRARISDLMGTADSVYLMLNIYRYGSAAAVLSTPLLVYLLLPRIYLILWYRSRRRWLVRRVKK